WASFVYAIRTHEGATGPAMNWRPARMPRVVILGGGVGGLAAARALRRASVEVILIDRTNHHLFQHLLYQVATSALTPGQIGWPIRNILRRQKNTTVILGEVTGVNKEKRYVVASSADRREVSIPYDYLILATGARQSYFGHDEFERFAPGMKTLGDAVAMRNHILRAFEQAEAEEDPNRHQDILTFVLVGAERTASRTVIWTAGVAPSPAGKWLAVATDRAGRVEVQPDLSVPGHPEVFVIGDTAVLQQDGKPLPGVAQVAMQQGRYAGRL